MSTLFFNISENPRCQYGKKIDFSPIRKRNASTQHLIWKWVSDIKNSIYWKTYLFLNNLISENHILVSKIIILISINFWYRKMFWIFLMSKQNIWHQINWFFISENSNFLSIRKLNFSYPKIRNIFLYVRNLIQMLQRY